MNVELSSEWCVLNSFRIDFDFIDHIYDFIAYLIQANTTDIVPYFVWMIRKNVILKINKIVNYENYQEIHIYLIFKNKKDMLEHKMRFN